MSRDDELFPTGPLGEPGAGWDEPEDDVTALLRAALRREAEAVRPSADGLARIRAAIAAEPSLAPSPVRRYRLRRFAPAVAAAAAVLAVGLGGANLLRPSTDEQPGAQGGATLVENTPTPAAVQPLPVYFAQERDGAWALVREFEPTSQTDPAKRLEQALRAAVAGKAADVDYTSIWRHLHLAGDLSVVAGDKPSVTLSGGLLGRAGLSSEGVGQDAVLARLAVQQLVWTATATLQQVVPVTVEAQGGAGRLLGVQQLGTFERETGGRDPRAPLWISSLTDGQDLRVGTATVTGDGLAGLDDVTWTLRRISASTGSPPTAATAATATTADAATTDGTTTVGPTGPDVSSSDRTGAAGPSALAQVQIVAQGRAPLLGDDHKAAAAGQRGTFTLHLTLSEPGTYELVVEQRGQAPTPSPGVVETVPSVRGTATLVPWSDTKTFRVH